MATAASTARTLSRRGDRGTRHEDGPVVALRRAIQNRQRLLLVHHAQHGSAALEATTEVAGAALTRRGPPRRPRAVRHRQEILSVEALRAALERLANFARRLQQDDLVAEIGRGQLLGGHATDVDRVALDGALEAR